MPPLNFKVFGIGGAGCNAVNRLASVLTAPLQLWAVNTNAQALGDSRAPFKLQIGMQTVRGISAGGNPTMGQRAAEESRAEIALALAGAEVVVVLAGMGGGTGTGAAPVLAASAREAGAVAIAIVTMPFTFEGRRRLLQAEAGLAALREQADLLLTMPNDAYLARVAPRTDMQAMFQRMDELPAMLIARLAALGAGADPGAMRGVVEAALAASPAALPPLWARRGFPPATGRLAPELGGAAEQTGLEPSL